MKLLVTNIRFNNNKEFEMKLPAVYADSSWLTAPYIRTYAFECIELDYDLRILPSNGNYTTEVNQIQPWDLDIIDVSKEQNVYDKYINIKVTPLVKSSIVVFVSDTSLKDFHNDIEQAVYNQLTFQLQADFLIEYIEGGVLQ